MEEFFKLALEVTPTATVLCATIIIVVMIWGFVKIMVGNGE